jgi:hypothetical protein
MGRLHEWFILSQLSIDIEILGLDHVMLLCLEDLLLLELLQVHLLMIVEGWSSNFFDSFHLACLLGDTSELL